MEQIRRSRNIVKPLVAEIDRLNAIIDENRTRLANDVPYAWNVFAFLSKRLSDQEKSEIRLASINADNAIRIKQIPLNKATAQLNQLCDQLAQRRVQEEKRIAAEKAHKANMERLARERAYEALRQEQARQQAERNKAAQEAAERFRQQQAEQARESAERARKERAAWEAILKACQEEEEAQERLRKQEADKERTRRSNERNASFGNCDHRCWWNKVEGYHICAHCTRPLFKFAEQCPSCNTIACASCRHILKTGGVPSAYKNDGHWSTGHARRRNRRG